MDREHAIASLALGISDATVLDTLTEFAASISDHGTAASPAKVITWAGGGGDLVAVVDAFINEQLFKYQQDSHVLMADLFCTLNQHCGLGYFVPIENFSKVILALDRKGRIKVRRCGNERDATVEFVQRVDFDDAIVLEQIGCGKGVACTELSLQLGIPTLLLQSILEQAIIEGRVVIDAPNLLETRYYVNIFMD
jgi:hypothetical protein